MRALSADWLCTSEARVLIEVPIAAQTEWEWIEAMEKRIRRAFEAGYAARKNDDGR
jgi:hypothetical protein